MCTGDVSTAASKFLCTRIAVHLHNHDLTLQVYYGLFFFGRHYFYKLVYPESWGSGEGCITFCGVSAKSFFGATAWLPSLQATLFMGNLLYLATLNKSLIIFACDKLPNGDYYLIDAPTVTCYTGDHVTLMVLAVVTLVCSNQTVWQHHELSTCRSSIL